MWPVSGNMWVVKQVLDYIVPKKDNFSKILKDVFKNILNILRTLAVKEKRIITKNNILC
jgi:hypothetical protein